MCMAPAVLQRNSPFPELSGTESGADDQPEPGWRNDSLGSREERVACSAGFLVKWRKKRTEANDQMLEKIGPGGAYRGRPPGTGRRG